MTESTNELNEWLEGKEATPEQKRNCILAIAGMMLLALLGGWLINH